MVLATDDKPKEEEDVTQDGGYRSRGFLLLGRAAARSSMAAGRQLRHDLGIFVFTLADAESATDHGSPSLL